MINGDLNYFVEKLNYGEDLYFVFQGKQYFVHGWINKLENGNSSEMFAYRLSDSNADEEIWSTVQDSLSKCAEQFLNAKLWNGKDFYQSETEIEWVD